MQPAQQIMQRLQFAIIFIADRGQGGEVEAVGKALLEHAHEQQGMMRADPGLRIAAQGIVRLLQAVERNPNVKRHGQAFLEQLAAERFELRRQRAVAGDNQPFGPCLANQQLNDLADARMAQRSAAPKS
ncbi:MAG: hypothetical protein BWZ10_03529 [candidate division BRC1 bacterium ADurb.BinA364]|nr:MAG: hypothetical protein BWZ10_03529 [candidate division BRC1 bacterium ADurb.BinA364]